MHLIYCPYYSFVLLLALPSLLLQFSGDTILAQIWISLFGVHAMPFPVVYYKSVLHNCLYLSFILNLLSQE